MSYFDDASLVMIPSGYKDQKVYSVKPLDGSGDLTFSRASSATRVASNGLIEKVRTNYLLNSNTFSTTWTNNNSTETSGQAGYDGTNNAWFLTAAGTSSAYIEQSITSSGLKNYSVYLKKGTSSFAALTFEGTGGGFSYFNLNTGAVGTSSVVTPSIQSVGSGWYRCSISAAPSGITGVRIYVTDADNSTNVTNGNNILMQASQLEDGDSATAYIATTSAAVSVGPVSGLPRLDYLNSTCPRLLLEPQRTNLVTYSEQFNVMSPSNLTVTANNATSPDGYTNADRLTPSGSGFHTIGNSISVTAGTPYTISFFYKNFDHKNIGFYDNNTSGSEISINVQDNTYTLGANVTAGGVISYGNGWYRAYATFSPSTTTMNNLIIFRDNTNNGNYTATGSYIWAYGWQVEAGAYATSYIPTLGTSVTRVADAASKTGISSLIGQTEGTIFLEVAVNNANSGNGVFFECIGASTADTFVLFIDATNNNLAFFNSDGTGLSEVIQTGYVPSTTVKIALGYKNSNFAVYVNGVSKSISALNMVPTALANIYLNSNRSGGEVAQSTYKQLLLFPTRLSNSDLAALTA